MDFTPEIVHNALSTLQAQGCILYPTDTIWGIGCDARSDKGVAKLYALKQRQDSKALICLVADLVMLEKYVGPIDPILLPYLNEKRPTTIIYPKVEGISDQQKLLTEVWAYALQKILFAKPLFEP